MSISKYCLTWDSHKNNVCNGFANLQQNEEFVDMTLAADGYLVNVHKSILALASPYIRSMLQATPSPHPVIFLSNINYEILNYILAYVYTGEVYVEVEKIQSFMKAAKDLRLSGLCNVPAPKVPMRDKSQEMERGEGDKGNNANRNAANQVITINEALQNNVSLNSTLPTTQITMNSANSDCMDTEQHVLPSEENESATNQTMDINGIQDILENRDSGLYTTEDGYQYKLEIPNVFDKPKESVFNYTDIGNDISESIKLQNVTASNGKSLTLPTISTESMSNTSSNIKSTVDPKMLTPQYTMSSRGSLQLIFNRYMYYCHHQSQGGRKRRWRCIDYRRTHCPAFIDTDCEAMTIRKFIHVHQFHDDKIRKKLKRNLIFTNLNCVVQKLNSDKSKGDKSEPIT